MRIVLVRDTATFSGTYFWPPIHPLTVTARSGYSAGGGAPLGGAEAPGEHRDSSGSMKPSQAVDVRPFATNTVQSVARIDDELRLAEQALAIERSVIGNQDNSIVVRE